MRQTPNDRATHQNKEAKDMSQVKRKVIEQALQQSGGTRYTKGGEILFRFPGAATITLGRAKDYPAFVVRSIERKLPPHAGERFRDVLDLT
jgi:hypothetical protein